MKNFSGQAFTSNGEIFLLSSQSPCKFRLFLPPFFFYNNYYTFILTIILFFLIFLSFKKFKKKSRKWFLVNLETFLPKITLLRGVISLQSQRIFGKFRLFFRLFFTRFRLFSFYSDDDLFSRFPLLFSFFSTSGKGSQKKS